MPGILKPLIVAPGKHIYNMLTSNEYRNYNRLESRLRSIERFKECSAKVHGWDIAIPDSPSFLSAYKEIFLDKGYTFPFHGKAPRVLDLGANIGLSVLNFKLQYPEAQITALEADPFIFSYLKRNIEGNGYDDVVLINQAAWHEGGVLNFSSEGADGGRVGSGSDIGVEGTLVEVEALDLPEYLMENTFDFLKMDIEGAEDTLLPAIKDFLPDFKFMMLEYHSKVGKPQVLDEMLSMVRKAGFRYHLHGMEVSPSPFAERIIKSGFDTQLNIYCWREEKIGEDETS